MLVCESLCLVWSLCEPCFHFILDMYGDLQVVRSSYVLCDWKPRRLSTCLCFIYSSILCYKSCPVPWYYWKLILIVKKKLAWRHTMQSWGSWTIQRWGLYLYTPYRVLETKCWEQVAIRGKLTARSSRGFSPETWWVLTHKMWTSLVLRTDSHPEKATTRWTWL